jgi:hypothetical protein
MDDQLTSYGSFVKDTKDLVYRHQYEAIKHVNSELIQLYWEMDDNKGYE